MRIVKAKDVNLSSGLFEFRIGFKTYNVGTMISEAHAARWYILHVRIMLIFWHLCFNIIDIDKKKETEGNKKNDVILLRIGQAVILIACIILIVVVCRTIGRMM